MYDLWAGTFIPFFRVSWQKYSNKDFNIRVQNLPHKEKGGFPFLFIIKRIKYQKVHFTFDIISVPESKRYRKKNFLKECLSCSHIWNMCKSKKIYCFWNFDGKFSRLYKILPLKNCIFLCQGLTEASLLLSMEKFFSVLRRFLHTTTLFLPAHVTRMLKLNVFSIN